MFLRHRLLALFIASFATSPTFAILSTDARETLHITADATSFNYKTGLTTYEGHVKADQGSSHLLADRIITQNNHHRIEEATAYGLTHPAKYWTTPKLHDPVFVAIAKLIKFYPVQSTVILEGHAIVTQGENSFEGPKLIYNMNTQIVTVPPSKDGRATIILQPNQLS